MSVFLETTDMGCQLKGGGVKGGEIQVGAALALLRPFFVSELKCVKPFD